MKRFFFLTLGIISCSIIPHSLSAQVFLGSATVRCKYEMSYKEDVTSREYKNDLIYLDIGREASHCYSIYAYYRDSVQSALLNKGIGGMAVGAQTSELRRGVEYVMAKQYKSRTLSVSDIVMVGHYVYNEPIPAIDWQITQETSTILSYPCRKATAQFRGRSWIAWFTTEIPLSEGPWQFGGLPGLILQLEDTQKHYIIAATGIEQLAPAVAMQFKTVDLGGKAYKKVNREQLAKLKREFYTNMEQYMRDYHGVISITTYDSDGSLMEPIPSQPYNPIELE